MKGNLFIPKPCHENWNKMSLEEQGRHCAVCSKVVKDFTQMKTEAIVDSLNNTEGEVCGRINIKELTPINKRQQLYFWLNGIVFRKAIYPLMALLGVTLLNKKAQAQTHDYPLKGKVAMNNYHTNSKKVTLVIKSNVGNVPIAHASITILDGLVNPIKNLSSDSNGRLSVTFDANDLISDEVEVEISAVGFELKRFKIKIIKDIQTIEIKMEDEMMIMGEMMYIPEEKIEPKITEKRDTIRKIEISKCTIKTIRELPEILAVDSLETFMPVTTSYSEDSFNHQPFVEALDLSSGFELFPVPSNNVVNIVSLNEQNFHVEIFDGNGKKIHSILNGNSRYTLDVSNYSTGIYYALITVGGKAIETKKIIVTR